VRDIDDIDEQFYGKPLLGGVLVAPWVVEPGRAQLRLRSLLDEHRGEATAALRTMRLGLGQVYVLDGGERRASVPTGVSTLAGGVAGQYPDVLNFFPIGADW